MSDVLIKGMEMPSCCGNCQFNQFHEADLWTTWDACMFLNNDTNNTGNGRLADCPLIPVPEHGDLVQLDDALDCFSEDDVVARKALRKIPVVLEKTT